jgi:23S rRNA pseudouridine2605 synthase
MSSSTLRLNRYLAQLGVASRRKADEMIAEGRISINGKQVRELGFKVPPGTKGIEIDGVPLERSAARKLYFVLNKPRGVVTTLRDPEGRPTVADLLSGIKERVYPVGRLDYDAEGVLLCTNDGDLAHRLTHPRYGAKKIYRVKVKGKPVPETIAKMRRGFRLEDGFAKPLDLKFEKGTKNNSWYLMTVAEGRNHLVKRMWLRAGHPVAKLVRINFAGISLGDLSPGEIRALRSAEVDRLLASGRE